MLTFPLLRMRSLFGLWIFFLWVQDFFFFDFLWPSMDLGYIFESIFCPFRRRVCSDGQAYFWVTFFWRKLLLVTIFIRKLLLVTFRSKKFVFWKIFAEKMKKLMILTARFWQEWNSVIFNPLCHTWWNRWPILVEFWICTLGRGPFHLWPSKKIQVNELTVF